MGECRNTAIVLAAGQGKRMHSKIQKQFMELDGMPVLCYSLRCFQESPLIRDVILVTGEEYVFWCKEEIVEKYGFTKVSAVVSGGKERYDSVYEGLLSCENSDFVLIHDGARPFITEEIYCTLCPEEESIMISAWPEFTEEWDFAADEEAVETIKEAVRGIRNVRTGMNVPPSKKAKVFVVSEDAAVREVFENGKVFFATLGYASEVFVQADKEGIAEDAVSAVIGNAVIYMPFAELVDIEKEIERLKKEEEKLEKELARVNGMLNMPARYSFPFDYCSGLSLVLDKNSMTEVTRSQLALFQIDISVLEEDLDTAHQWYICKTPPSMCHVFEELYAAKEHETSQYFRIKVLELLYHATKLRKEDRVAATYYAREHIEIVKRVRKAMLKDLSRSTPLEQFLRGEAISTVTFQTIFKQIYGRSPYAYLKHYRMNSAAVQLRESNESINQIALSLGYSNASKFARAFRDVFGVLPKDYRTAQKAI